MLRWVVKTEIAVNIDQGPKWMSSEYKDNNIIYLFSCEVSLVVATYNERCNNASAVYSHVVLKIQRV